MRCTHCYSESGLRPSSQVGLAEQERIADALISLRPRAVQFSGGEPLLVPDVYRLARRFRAAGVRVGLFTGSWLLDAGNLGEMLDAFSSVHVSLDGASAGVHDRSRGRQSHSHQYGDTRPCSGISVHGRDLSCLRSFFWLPLTITM
ncbi:radical SAM protein [Streptomyces avermitilis]|uniref:radical SAM protein n=1 Tax=Streptomyces avermitilis TaxID=33903 RepID=UPI00381515C4